MMKALRVKFNHNIDLKNKLINTGDVELVEDSPYDYYWGVGRKGTGKNRLGILLMELRQEFIGSDK